MFKRKENLMFRILKLFSLTLITIITLFAILVGLILIRQDFIAANKSLRDTSNRLIELTLEKQRMMARILEEMNDSHKEFKVLDSYFTMNESEFLQYTLTNNLLEDGFFPTQMFDFYFQNDDLESIVIQLNAYEDIFYSSKVNKAGKKVKTIPPTPNLTLRKSIQNKIQLEGIGMLELTFSKQKVDNILSTFTQDFRIEVFLISDDDQIEYTNTSNHLLTEEIDRQLEDGEEVESILLRNHLSTVVEGNKLQVYATVSYGSIIKKSLLIFIVLLLFSFAVDGILLLFLFRLLDKYADQVENILYTIRKITTGSRSDRVQIDDKQSELKEISLGINDMLSSLNQYIRDNYELELSQQEANFRALQAQIDPHFMYNTLEYIRMYAYSEGMEELSEVVYSFATILRNNISQEKMSTLESELKFIERYVFLYQMRYPENVAYSFSIEEEVSQVKIPKFCVQPLVENYFAHGIDYRRIDNAISIKAYQEGSYLKIHIIDNGQGIPPMRLAEINEYLEKGQRTKTPDSIGIYNVHERFKIMFSDYQMTFMNTSGGGLTILISIGLEEGESCIQ